MNYQFTAYDVLQVKRQNRWVDVSTLRTEDEGFRAVAIVDRGFVFIGDDPLEEFRIVTPGIDVVRYTGR